MNSENPQIKFRRLTPSVPRIVEGILGLIARAEKKGLRVTQYDIVKSLFLSDRAHLNKYGRPITFDNYVAMKHGPVPSLAFDILKGTSQGKLALAKHKIIVPWKSRPAPELGVTCVAYENPIRAYSDEILSKTDIDELYSALTIVKSLGFTQIRRLTHQDQAYIDAWKSDGGRRQYPMRYELLFDKPNESVATDIAFLSHHIH